jgi:hypothetical protein
MEKMVELNGLGGTLEAGVSEENLAEIVIAQGTGEHEVRATVKLNRSQLAQLISYAQQVGGVVD